LTDRPDLPDLTDVSDLPDLPDFPDLLGLLDLLVIWRIPVDRPVSVPRRETRPRQRGLTTQPRLTCRARAEPGRVDVSERPQHLLDLIIHGRLDRREIPAGLTGNLVAVDVGHGMMVQEGRGHGLRQRPAVHVACDGQPRQREDRGSDVIDARALQRAALPDTRTAHEDYAFLAVHLYADGDIALEPSVATVPGESVVGDQEDDGVFIDQLQGLSKERIGE
jgi:hypothetical protein